MGSATCWGKGGARQISQASSREACARSYRSDGSQAKVEGVGVDGAHEAAPRGILRLEGLPLGGHARRPEPVGLAPGRSAPPRSHEEAGHDVADEDDGCHQPEHPYHAARRTAVNKILDVVDGVAVEGVEDLLDLEEAQELEEAEDAQHLDGLEGRGPTPEADDGEGHPRDNVHEEPGPEVGPGYAPAVELDELDLGR